MSIKKNFLAMCLIGLVLVLGLSLWNSADAKSSADLENDIRVDTTKNADEKDKLTAFMVLEMERARLRSELGPNSVYPEFYVGVEQEKLTGKTEPAAIREMENEMVEQEALVWYASSHDLRITDEEARQRMEQALAEVKNADNYAELVEACKAAGTTIEATILENEDFYKKIYMRTNLCDTKHETFMEDQSISEKGSEEWEIHWNAFVKETIAAYKETEEFSILAKKITNSKELIHKGITDVTKIKAMEQ